MSINEIYNGHAVHVSANEHSVSIVIASGADYYNSTRYRFLWYGQDHYVAKVGAGKLWAKDKKFIRPNEAPKYARLIADRVREIYVD